MGKGVGNGNSDNVYKLVSLTWGPIKTGPREITILKKKTNEEVSLLQEQKLTFAVTDEYSFMFCKLQGSCRLIFI